MTRVLILSSMVACGHVGLSAGQPVLQALGHRVTALPTVLLSNHPGFEHVSGQAISVAHLDGMVEALDRNGWLGAHDAVLLGYMPSEAHVDLAERLVRRMRERSPARLRVVVDPVLGDWPKGLYVAEAVAVALREKLIPMADVVTPNIFELEWLTGSATERAARGLAPEVCVTSWRAAEGMTGLLRVSGAAREVWSVPVMEAVPQGVGDVFAALVAAGLPVAQALGHLQALIAESLGAPHLRIVESLDIWRNATPLDNWGAYASGKPMRADALDKNERASARGETENGV